MMNTARLTLHPAFSVGDVAPTLFGSFVEHMGRCVYGGIFDPGNPLSDRNGIRRDVSDLVRELGTTAIRYPGGNFVSGFDWEDSVGPASERPTRLDLAWRTREPNTFGLNEFLTWCRDIEVEPILALNLGTRGVDAARALVEYTNIDHGSKWADLRRSHGVADPWHVKYWCLGNEMDGPWQIGQKSPREYAVLARETAKALRVVDPDVKLIACGSSHENMPTFGEWERVVLDEAYDEVDYLSLHAYYQQGPQNTLLLESGHAMDEFIRGVIATADSVRARRKASRRIMLAFDEWNVIHPESVAPQSSEWEDAGTPLSECEYSPLDAVVVGDLLTTLLQHADRVRIAAIAQLVNVLAPITTTVEGAERQTIYYPFALLSATAHGTVLRGALDAPSLPSDRFGEVPGINAAAVLSPTGTEITVSVVNRSLTGDVPFAVALDGFSDGFTLCERTWMTAETPVPERACDTALRASLPPASWTVLRYKRARAC
jgi:alpha-N-arabinofuranosidase